MTENPYPMPMPRQILRPIRQPLWDRLLVKKGGPQTLKFFTEPRSNSKGPDATNLHQPGMLPVEEFSILSVGLRAVKSLKDLPQEFLERASIDFFLSNRTLFESPVIMLTKDQTWDEFEKKFGEEIERTKACDPEKAEDDIRKDINSHVHILGQALNIGKLRFRIRPTEYFYMQLHLNGFEPKEGEEFYIWGILSGVLWKPI